MGGGRQLQDKVALITGAASDASSYVTGAVIPVDGGLLSGHRPPMME